MGDDGFDPVVPPLQTRRDPWEYDVGLYNRRTEIERLFGCIKRFRRVFTRYDKTDQMFSAFITLAFLADLLRRWDEEAAPLLRRGATRRRRT